MVGTVVAVAGGKPIVEVICELSDNNGWDGF